MFYSKFIDDGLVGGRDTLSKQNYDKDEPTNHRKKQPQIGFGAVTGIPQTETGIAGDGDTPQQCQGDGHVIHDLAEPL